MKDLINYKSFVSFLNENKLFNENLPTKTIYRKVKKILVSTTNTLTGLDVVDGASFPLLSNFSVMMMIQISNEVNLPFFGYYNALSVMIKKEKGKFIASIEKGKDRSDAEEHLYSALSSLIYGKL